MISVTADELLEITFKSLYFAYLLRSVKRCDVTMLLLANRLAFNSSCWVRTEVDLLLTEPARRLSEPTPRKRTKAAASS